MDYAREFGDDFKDFGLEQLGGWTCHEMRWGKLDGTSLGKMGEDQEFSLGPIKF